ncbi:hypothetical protein LINPERPRIM_LOCUS24631 [Linum perenne]
MMWFIIEFILAIMWSFSRIYITFGHPHLRLRLLQLVFLTSMIKRGMMSSLMILLFHLLLPPVDSNTPRRSSRTRSSH